MALDSRARRPASWRLVRFIMILFLFFCSGATALVYEVVWSKYLSLMFGSTVQAQTVVLAVFMGGLALGNRLVGARSDLLKQPLAAYGCLEVIIGLYAFFFSAIYQLGDRVFITAGSRLLEHPFGLLVLKGSLSVGLLLAPTILMGGTLPLLSAWLQKQSNDAGRWSARFYSTNSLGAVCGSWLAGFFLIRSLGLVSTLQMTALTNVIIGLIAIALGRRALRTTEGRNATEATPDTSSAGEPVALRSLTLLVALTGGVSMGLEVLASRSLTLIFGASLQAFAIVLMAFILGIGLGSAAVASPRLKRWRSESLIFVLLLVAAGVIGVLILGIEQWVEAYRQMRTGLARSVMGYRFYQLSAGWFSLVILGLPAGLIGAVLPLCIRLSSGGGEGFGNRVGRLLTWNTLGAVVGVLVTGFLLMPKVGLRNSFNVLALVLCAAVFLLAWRTRNNAFLASASLVAGGLALSCAFGGEGWRFVLSSGVFRDRETSVDPTTLLIRKQHTKLLFYEDAADATVTVEQGDGVGADADIGLRISGKPEASSKGDLSTQLLLAHLPMLARPESKEVFVLGLASGLTASGFLAYPIEHLTVAENCAPVVRAAAFFTPWNRGVLTNHLTRIWLEDARTVLKLRPQKYDVIVSEPSNPWFASIGSVFTREFYELAASRLKPGGLMVQWFHMYEMHDGIVDLVLRTFGTVFPEIEVWDINGGDMILIGSDRRWNNSLADWRKVYELESVQKDLASIGLGTPEALMARQLASQRTGAAIAGLGPIQSDAFPVLEYEAPLAFYVGGQASRISRFDERTWQSAFASGEKRAALTNLNDKIIREVFNGDSINHELWQLVVARLQKTAGHGSGPAPSGVPCLFLPSGGEEKIPANASEDQKRLLRARAALQSDEEKWEQEVQTMRSTLLARLSNGGQELHDRSDVQFAVVAARACIVHGNFALAKEMLTLGFRIAPDEPELGYLVRVMGKEQATGPLAR
jgi:spermidine synthase